jgi:hypothetical protein
MTLLRVNRTDTNDKHYDPTPRKVWWKDQLIEDWVVADEFRRVVILEGGKVLNGAVCIERVRQDFPAYEPPKLDPLDECVLVGHTIVPLTPGDEQQRVATASDADFSQFAESPMVLADGTVVDGPVELPPGELTEQEWQEARHDAGNHPSGV